MIVASGLELRAGARLLLGDASFQVAAGDKIGLVGRNGAGKTTLARVLAGEALPAGGTVQRTGTIGYLPQDSRAGDLTGLAMDRVLSARGLDEVRAAMRTAEEQMADPDPARRDAAVRRYGNAEERLHGLGGYAAEAEAASIAASLGLPGRVLSQPLRTLSGGQRRRVELARILFSGAGTLLLDEPTNHLDADSISWLRDHLRAFRGAVMVISHNTALLDAVVNKVFYLDADRTTLDIYNVGWRTYLDQRETDARRRAREAQNSRRQAAALQAQADKMRAKATKAKAAQGMERRAQRLLAGVAADRRPERVARLRFPVPEPCGKTPLVAGQVLRFARGVHRRRHGGGPRRPDRGARPERGGKDHAAAAAYRPGTGRRRRGAAGPRAAPGLLRPGARDAGPGPDRPGEHGRRGTRPHRR